MTKHFRVKRVVPGEEEAARYVCTYRLMTGRTCGKNAISILRALPAFACSEHRNTMNTMSELHDEDLAARQIERFDRED